MSGVDGQQYPKEATQAFDILHGVLGSSVVGVYLFGSAVVGGLRQSSDVDVLAVIRKPLSGEIRQSLAARLMKVSGTGRDGNSARCIELTVVNLSDVVPWRYPPNSEFVYGEWLRETFQARPIARPDPDPDLVIVLAKVRENSVPMFGPSARDLFDLIPIEDVRRAIAESLPRLIGALEGDERNVLLTLARMWMTVATGKIGPKDVAAGWALERLPQEHSALLSLARWAYLGKATDEWQGRNADLDALVSYMKQSIEAYLQVEAEEEP